MTNAVEARKGNPDTSGLATRANSSVGLDVAPTRKAALIAFFQERGISNEVAGSDAQPVTLLDGNWVAGSLEDWADNLALSEYMVPFFEQMIADWATRDQKLMEPMVSAGVVPK